VSRGRPQSGRTLASGEPYSRYDVDRDKPWKVEVWDGQWLYHGGARSEHDAIVERHRLEGVTGQMTRVVPPRGKKSTEQREPLWWLARMAAEGKGPPLTQEQAARIEASNASLTLPRRPLISQRDFERLGRDAPVLPPGTKRG